MGLQSISLKIGQPEMPLSYTKWYSWKYTVWILKYDLQLPLDIVEYLALHIHSCHTVFSKRQVYLNFQNTICDRIKLSMSLNASDVYTNPQTIWTNSHVFGFGSFSPHSQFTHVSQLQCISTPTKPLLWWTDAAMKRLCIALMLQQRASQVKQQLEGHWKEAGNMETRL